MKTLVYSIIGLFTLIGYIISQLPQELFHETGSIIAVCVISVPVWYGLYQIHKFTGLMIMVVLGIYALGIETIALHTGFPYSHFEYIADFGYRLFSTTPWTVCIAWSPLVIGVYTITHTWSYTPWKRWFLYILLLVSVDMVLDPGAVARGLWVYQNGGFWYGVPITNFLGWIFSGTIAYGIMTLFYKYQKNHTFNVWLGLPLVASLGLWSGVTIGYGMFIPAGIGIVLITIFSSTLCKKTIT